MKGQRSRLLKGAAWVSAANILINLLGLVSLFLLTRLLVPEDFGLVAIATALAEIIGVVTELTLASALVQRRTIEPVHFDTAWTLNVLRASVVAVLFFLISSPFAQFYGDDRLALIVQVLAFATFVGGFRNPRLILFKRELDFSKTFIMQVTNKVSAFIATVGVAVAFQSYWALIAGITVSAVATVIMSYLIIPYKPRFALAAWRDLLSFSIWITLGRWVQALNWRAQPLLFGFVLPTSILGQYNVSQRLLGKVIEQAVQPIQGLLFPAFSRLQDQAERLRRGYIRSQGTMCLITFPIACGFALLAEDLVILTIGEQWLPAATLIQFSAVIRMLQTVENVNALAMATANTKALFFRDLLAFFIRWPLIIAGLLLGGDTPFERLTGALASQIIAVAITTLWNMRLISRISTVAIRDHAALAWRSLASVLAMSAVVLTAQSVAPVASDWWSLAVRVSALSTLGAATYFGALYVIWILKGRDESVEHELAIIVRDMATKVIAKARAN